MSRLMYISTAVLEELTQSVPQNLHRYKGSGFSDLVAKGNWSIESSLEIDLTPLSELDPAGTPESEVKNSLLVWKVLHGLSPSLASEERIWARICHVECLDYAYNRWVKNLNEEKVVSSIEKHFFAKGIAGCRDDNAVSRLWWNAKIAKVLRPSDQKGAIELMLKRADTRLNSLERSRMFRRPAVGAGVLRVLEGSSWVGENENNFRVFMRTLNKRGSGVLFEAFSDLQVDVFMNKCITEAKKIVDAGNI